MKRDSYFITCNCKYNIDNKLIKKDFIEANLVLNDNEKNNINIEQLSLFNG